MITDDIKKLKEYNEQIFFLNIFLALYSERA